MLTVADLVVDFPLENRTVRAVDGLSFTIRPGQRLGVVGGIGFGQVDRGDGRARTARASGEDRRGLDQAGRARARWCGGGRASHRARRPDRDDLPGRPRLAEPREDDRLSAHRGDPAAQRCRKVRRRREVSGALGGGGSADAARAPRAVSARVLGRDAAAGDDRDGACVRSRAADRRRADDGARRDDAGRRDRPAPSPLGRAPDGGDADHPRPRDHRELRRGRARHVRRRPGRVRRGGRGLRERGPPVHAGPHRGRSPARRRAGRNAAVDPRRAAPRRRHAAGL